MLSLTAVYDQLSVDRSRALYRTICPVSNCPMGARAEIDCWYIIIKRRKSSKVFLDHTVVNGDNSLPIERNGVGGCASQSMFWLRDHIVIQYTCNRLSTIYRFFRTAPGQA